MLVIVLFAGIGGLVVAVRSQSSPRTRIVRRAIRQLRRFDVLYRAAAMQSKVKLGFGVWQCLSAAPAVFGISIPDGGDHLNALSNLLTFPALLGVDLILPGACYGSFRPRLLVNALWPFALIALTVLCGTSWELYRGAFAAREVVVAARTGLQRTLPVVLVLTFVLLPSQSMRILMTFLCDRIAFDDLQGASRRCELMCHTNLGLNANAVPAFNALAVHKRRPARGSFAEL